ncbi:hypothetical protein [Nocardioides sp.]|uniref:hypothetical protein n=1 Tax=Nocardioides sp. TaxID=35761 RepID=UPI00261BA072|nr:hypothetical protein [Nocardioides sp.]
MGEFGVDAAIAVGAPRGDVISRIGRSANLGVVVWLKWAGSCSDVAGAGDVQHSAALLDRDAGVDESVDHRVNPFGCGFSSLRNPEAGRTIASAVSSSRIPLSRRLELSGLGGGDPSELAAVDVVLADQV